MPSIPVSKTKIIPPRRRAELLSRKRLLDLMFEALDKKLTLVSAPAGYGKTSLLIDTVHHSGLPCCWLALDEMDADPRRFAAYFIAALSARFPNFGGGARSLLESMDSFEGELERFVVTLVNELYDEVKEHFIFVLDDFHLLEGVQPIYAFVNRFISLVDDNCHLVVSSRTLTELKDLPLLIVREQAAGLDHADLAFRREELQALLAQNGGAHLSDEEAGRLIDESEGWITGLQFSNAGIWRGNAKKPALDAGRGGSLPEFLGQQALDRQPPELREFVLRTSMFEEFDASLCESVLAPFYNEEQDWQSLIDAVIRNNLFALPVGEDGRWVRYHHLFRDFIRERFERERRSEIQPILLRLQAAYEAMGEWVKAYHTCRKLGDIEALANLIERAGAVMVQNEHVTMEKWLTELPPSMLNQRPGLLSIRGAIAHFRGDTGEGLNLLRKAGEEFRREENRLGLTLNLVRLGTALRILGDYAASLACGGEIIQLAETDDAMQEYYADGLRIKGLALYRLGRAREAVDVLERSLNTYTRLNAFSQIPVLAMETGMAYRAIGDFEAARSGYEQALKVWLAEGNLYSQTGLLNNMGGLYQALGEYERSAQVFEEGLLCARRSRNIRYEGLITLSLGDLYAELEDFEMAQQAYERADEIIRGMTDRFLSNSLAFSKAAFTLAQKDLPLAESILDEVKDSVQTGGSKYEESQFDLLRGRLRLLDGNPQEAINHFQNAVHLLLTDGREMETNVARVWLAAAYRRNENLAEAAQILAETASHTGKNLHGVLAAVHQANGWLGGLQGDSTLGRNTRDMIAQAKRLAEKFPGIRRQLRRQAQAISGPVPRLLIRAFGGASVSVEGRLLTSSDWQTQSVRELFFFLLSTPKPLAKEKIGETLWQEQYSGAKLKLRFKNDLYRLRRAIGQEDVVLYRDDRYAFNRGLDHEYDVEAFEAYLSKAKAAEDPKAQAEYLQKAADLFQGPYLNDLDVDWAGLERERLGQAYLNALLALSGLYLKEAQMDSCIETCQRAEAFDPGCEPAYQIHMQALARLGDRPGVQRVYQTCRDALQNLFNLPPSKETEDLYQRLMK